MLSKALNYSKAAKALYISQPVLTRHIQALEAEFGVTLLQRTTHGVSLTEPGRLLSSQAGEFLDKCGSALNLLRIQNLPVKGVVRVCCGLEISYAAHIRDFISGFMGRYPDIEVAFHVAPQNTPPEVMDNFDFLFTPCEFHPLPPNLRQHLLFSHGTYAVLPPEHPLMTRPLIALHQLAGEVLIVPYADEFFGPYAQNWLLAEKSTRGRLGCIKVPNLSTALFMASIGKGLVIVPRYVKNMVPPGTFVVGISDRACRFNEYLYYNTQRNNGAAKLFYEEFREAYDVREE